MFQRATEEALVQLRRERQAQEYLWNPQLWAKDRAGLHLWSKQAEIAQSVVDNHDVIVKAGHGVGKAVDAATPLPTPTGWLLAGDVRVGDTLLDEAGHPTSVSGLSPTWDRPEYRITFDDGSEILTGPEHEWTALDLMARSRAHGTKSGVRDWRDFWHTAKTLETQELAASLRTPSGQYRWRIPLASPLQLPEADLPIDPYLLGFWLGDGSTASGQIAFGATKSAFLDWLNENNYDHSMKWNDKQNCWIGVVKGLQTQLRELGVLGNKHIPQAYLRASESQRRALLAGLMDADGFLMKNSGKPDVGIDLTCSALADGLYELLMTLGCKVWRNQAEAAYTKNGERTVTGTRYRMNWRPLENPFRLRETAWVDHDSHRSRHSSRSIVDIQLTGRRIKNFCLQVDSPRSLYLAGESFIPTHNSKLAAILLCWWIDTRWPYGRVASTAPSHHQISAIIWYEVREIVSLVNKRHAEGLTYARMPGHITSDNDWKTDDGQRVGFGRKPPDHKTDDAFQGIHAVKHGVFAVGDEGCGLQQDMIDALGNITPTEDSRRLIILNPTNPAAYVGTIFREDFPNWTKHTISVFDNPNFTGEVVPDNFPLAALADQSFVDNKKAEYGEGTPRYISRILGEFAFDNDQSLIVAEDLAVAHDLDIAPTGMRPVLGVDVARFGDDLSVVYTNDCGRVRKYDSWGRTDGVTTAERIHKIARETMAAEVRIDGTGIGGPVADIVRRLRDDAGSDYDIIEMMAGWAPDDRSEHANARAQWFDRFRYNLRAGIIDLDPTDSKLTDELGSIQYKIQDGTQALIIESKNDIRKQGRKSPDFADAVIYATADLGYLDEPQPGDRMQLDSAEFAEVGRGIGYLDAVAW